MAWRVQQIISELLSSPLVSQPGIWEAGCKEVADIQRQCKSSVSLQGEIYCHSIVAYSLTTLGVDGTWIWRINLNLTPQISSWVSLKN